MSNNTQVVPKTQAQVTINGNGITHVIYKDQPVLTFVMIDQVHQRVEGTAADRFKKNRKRFIENEDFYLVDYSQKGILYPFGIDIPPRGLTVLTQTGYAMLAKVFTDDLAWQIQRELVKKYFTVVKPVESESNELELKRRLSFFPDDVERSMAFSKDEPLLPRLSDIANVLTQSEFIQLIDNVPYANAFGLCTFFDFPYPSLVEQIEKKIQIQNRIIQDDMYFINRQGFLEISACFKGVTAQGASRYIKRENFLLAFDRLENKNQSSTISSDEQQLKYRLKKITLELLNARPEWEDIVRYRYAGFSAAKIADLIGVKEYRVHDAVKRMKQISLLPNQQLTKRATLHEIVNGLV